jgi:ketosteroid isomerase-like protein
MKIFLILIFTFATVTAFGQSAKSNDKLREEIRKLDLAHAEAILKKDTTALKNLIADDAVTNHPTNKIVKERDGIFELIRNGTINYSSFVREPEEFLFFKDMVVVMGHETLTQKSKTDGALQTINRRYTNVWMKRNGKWQLSIRHAHIVCAN